jgi:hypothetical protein
MDNPQKLASQVTQDKEKKRKKLTQCALDTIFASKHKSNLCSIHGLHNINAYYNNISFVNFQCVSV